MEFEIESRRFFPQPNNTSSLCNSRLKRLCSLQFIDSNKWIVDFQLIQKKERKRRKKTISPILCWENQINDNSLYSMFGEEINEMFIGIDYKIN